VEGSARVTMKHESDGSRMHAADKTGGRPTTIWSDYAAHHQYKLIDPRITSNSIERWRIVKRCSSWLQQQQQQQCSGSSSNRIAQSSDIVGTSTNFDVDYAMDDWIGSNTGMLITANDWKLLNSNIHIVDSYCEM